MNWEAIGKSECGEKKSEHKGGKMGSKKARKKIERKTGERK